MTREHADHNPQEDMPPREGALTRREFARVSSLLALSTVFTAPHLPKGLFSLGGTARAKILSEHTEHLPNGGVRTTGVVELENVGTFSGRMTATHTKQPTPDGDLIEISMATMPRLATYDGNEMTTFVARYDFVHGPVNGDYREDAVTISAEFNGKPLGSRQHQMRRPLTSHLAQGMTSEQQLALGMKLFEQHGGTWPDTLPGAAQITDPTPDMIRARERRKEN